MRDEDVKTDPRKLYASAGQLATQEVTNAVESSSVLDRLKSKRAIVAREYSRRIKELDRQITLLESSDAESIMKQAERILYQE